MLYWVLFLYVIELMVLYLSYTYTQNHQYFWCVQMDKDLDMQISKSQRTISTEEFDMPRLSQKSANVSRKLWLKIAYLPILWSAYIISRQIRKHLQKIHFLSALLEIRIMGISIQHYKFFGKLQDFIIEEFLSAIN